MALDLAVIQRFLPPASRGGAGHFTAGLCTALAGRGHRVTVFSQDPRPPGAPFDVVQLAGRERRTAPLMFPAQIARIDVGRFDLVHAQGDDQLLRHRGRPVVRTLHGSSLDEAMANGVRGLSPKHALLHAWFFTWEVVAALRADAVVGVSRAAARHLPRRADVIPNGIDTAAFAPDGTPKSHAPSILFVGELDSRKRGRMLVEQFIARVGPRVPGSELWLVSPDRAEGPGVIHLGTLDDASLRDAYRRAWVMCLPSAYEGFGRPYVEALAAGTPVAASPNPGAMEVLDGGRYGVIAPDAALGDALADLLTDPARRTSLADAGLARARQYDWSVVADAYERVYARVLRGQRGAA
jgi:glycosyltransferase involved in cell wall biosynthesis